MSSSTSQALRTGTFLSAINLLLQAVSFMGTNLMANRLGSVGFGQLGLLQNDYLLFLSIADFGTSSVILAFWGRSPQNSSLLPRLMQIRIALALATWLLFLTFTFSLRWNHPIFWAELLLSPALLFHHGFFDWFYISQHQWKGLLYAKFIQTISYVLTLGGALLLLGTTELEGVAIALLLAGIPAWLYGAHASFSSQMLRIQRHARRFAWSLLQKTLPLGLSSAAGILYLPLGLYALDSLHSDPQRLGGFSAGYKLIVLLSSLMVQFLLSHVAARGGSRSASIPLRGTLQFGALATLPVLVIWLFPELILRLLFVGLPWTPELLDYSAWSLRILSLSLLFQAWRAPLISDLLAQRRTWTWLAYLTGAGLCNLLACALARMSSAPWTWIPLATLSADAVLTGILWLQATYNRRWS